MSALEPGLVDTNILVYAYAQTHPRYSPAARRFVRELIRTQNGYLTVQTQAEFAQVGLSKTRPPLAASDISRILTSLQRVWAVLTPDRDTVHLALGGVADLKPAFWDAMLWAIAKQHGVGVIYSQDLPGRVDLQGVVMVDPLPH